jgi:hypothetical protein
MGYSITAIASSNTRGETTGNLSRYEREGLPEGARIERREDGSVWLVELPPPGAIRVDAKGNKHGPDRTESRVDSVRDIDVRRRGGVVWYDRFLKSAK